MSRNTIIVLLVVIAIAAIGGFVLVSNKNQTNNTSTMKSYTTAQPSESAVNPSSTTQPSGTTMKSGVQMSKSAKFGEYVAAANGMTLYTFDKDSANVSNCSGSCATEWPPYTVSGAAPSPMPAHLGTMKRSDGSMQYTWDSKPLYFFAEDKAVGDTNGDGYSALWHIAK